MGASLCTLATPTGIVQHWQGGSREGLEPDLNGSAMVTDWVNEPVDRDSHLRRLILDVRVNMFSLTLKAIEQRFGK
jgi:hypothetical protein